MGYKEISLKLPADYEEDQLRRSIAKELAIKEFSYQIERKSLDARKRGSVPHWLIRVSVLSEEIKGGEPIPCRRHHLKRRRISSCQQNDSSGACKAVPLPS